MQSYSFASKAFTKGLILRSPSKPSSFSLINNSQVIKRNPANINGNVTAHNRQSFRLMSSNSGSNPSGKWKVAVLSLFGGTLLGYAGIAGIGYAGIDPEFRAYVEGLIPGAKDAFEAILGNPELDEG